MIDQPVLRLVSVDLGCAAEISSLDEVFDFARDYLGLLKAAVIAAGLTPPGLEGSEQKLSDLLSQMVVGGPGRGIELVSKVNDIPKGSRLAVSTNLLACLISVCMRATGQTRNLVGPLDESERRVVAARAILGEWLGGSGGGWQDSGGVWPGMKLIQGALAQEGDVEFNVSRGRLLPNHTILGRDEGGGVSDATRQALQDSLVLVHGGMAQNVGPILEMVSEKYLLRSEKEWHARQKALGVLDSVLSALKTGNIRALANATTQNFFGPIQTIIPWASTFYTELLIERIKASLGDDFWGFWMLGGMSGGGMGFIVAPHRKTMAQELLQKTMTQAKKELASALPFAMEPVVYDFAINERGTWAELLTGNTGSDPALRGGGAPHGNAGLSMMPPSYYELMVPGWLRQDVRSLTPAIRADLERFGQACQSEPAMTKTVDTVFHRLIPQSDRAASRQQSLAQILSDLGFDREQHETIRSSLIAGRIGLSQNRLPQATTIEDVRASDVIDVRAGISDKYLARGNAALKNGQVAVVSLAAGVGSRWTQGAGVVKALHPFCKFGGRGGRHRSFLEVHLAKTRKVSRSAGTVIPHIVTTSWLTHDPIAAATAGKYTDLDVILSPGRAVGLRLIPMVRDLRFAWEEMSHQQLDEQKQKMRDSLHAALMNWAQSMGEGSDYTDNLPAQCLHPVGHWFEIPNLLRNGVLRDLLSRRPNLTTLMLHNIDTLGADVDPRILGLHLETGGCLSFEVISRRLEDRGGGLARIDGRTRLLEGMAMPREQDEFHLSYYNSATTWIDIDKLLAAFGLARPDLSDTEKVAAAVRKLAARMPTYITLKDVKKRWGQGQEDVFPVAQFEKLWGDMTALPEVDSRFFVVPRQRGQQLKDAAQLDGWYREGGAAHLETLCAWK
ncbi:MAG: UTP--glucose-1-phosphate uridylyltransferase [Phycisphaerales bacterium]|nr:UTP--glucose-1-phosphate uridylyltransferase [Phycisphaerales bacterium]